MPHICVCELCLHWLVTCLAPSHCLNQCWLIVNWTLWNKLQWNWNQNSNFSFLKMYLKMLSAKWRPFCSGRWVNIKSTRHFCLVWLKISFLFWHLPQWGLNNRILVWRGCQDTDFCLPGFQCNLLEHHCIWHLHQPLWNLQILSPWLMKQ